MAVGWYFLIQQKFDLTAVLWTAHIATCLFSPLTLDIVVMKWHNHMASWCLTKLIGLFCLFLLIAIRHMDKSVVIGLFCAGSFDTVQNSFTVYTCLSPVSFFFCFNFLHLFVDGLFWALICRLIGLRGKHGNIFYQTVCLPKLCVKC